MTDLYCSPNAFAILSSVTRTHYREPTKIKTTKARLAHPNLKILAINLELTGVEGLIRESHNQSDPKVYLIHSETLVSST